MVSVWTPLTEQETKHRRKTLVEETLVYDLDRNENVGAEEEKNGLGGAGAKETINLES